MPAKLIDFKLDSKGVRELLRSDEVEQMLESLAESRVPSNGCNYEVKSKKGSHRANAVIRVGDAHAYYHELKHNDLLKAVK